MQDQGYIITIAIKKVSIGKILNTHIKYYLRRKALKNVYACL